jgi:hypothetical protein
MPQCLLKSFISAVDNNNMAAVQNMDLDSYTQWCMFLLSIIKICPRVQKL